MSLILMLLFCIERSVAYRKMSRKSCNLFCLKWCPVNVVFIEKFPFPLVTWYF